MTNEEIITHYNNTGAMSSIIDLLDLARADEREKLQGVDAWVSWSGDEVDNRIPCVSRTKPEILNNGDYCQTSQGFNISRYEAQSLNISPGECAKFKIVRCE